jgi:putative oxidoreductase
MVCGTRFLFLAAMLNRFPFISLPHSLVVLRVATAIMFMAHAGVRAAHNTVPQFAAFMAGKGFAYPVAVVWGITVFELVGGLLLILGVFTRWVTVGLLAIAGGGIVLIHFKLGWFVGEHGTGGMEYSVLLMVALLVIAAADRARIQSAA